jgi:hypothetical protein
MGYFIACYCCFPCNFTHPCHNSLTLTSKTDCKVRNLFRFCKTFLIIPILPSKPCLFLYPPNFCFFLHTPDPTFFYPPRPYVFLPIPTLRFFTHPDPTFFYPPRPLPAGREGLLPRPCQQGRG